MELFAKLYKPLEPIPPMNPHENAFSTAKHWNGFPKPAQNWPLHKGADWRGFVLFGSRRSPLPCRRASRKCALTNTEEELLLCFSCDYSPKGPILFSRRVSPQVRNFARTFYRLYWRSLRLRHHLIRKVSEKPPPFILPPFGNLSK